ncbi:MAG: hypothetical protein ACPGVN_05705 [Alphaproteobacteria bacterium]
MTKRETKPNQNPIHVGPTISNQSAEDFYGKVQDSSFWDKVSSFDFSADKKIQATQNISLIVSSKNKFAVLSLNNIAGGENGTIKMKLGGIKDLIIALQKAEELIEKTENHID